MNLKRKVYTFNKEEKKKKWKNTIPKRVNSLNSWGTLRAVFQCKKSFTQNAYSYLKM